MSTWKKVLFLCLVVLVGGLSGIIANRFLFPYLSTTRLFSKYEFLKQTNREVTIINKTEEIYVKEDTSVSKIANLATATVVNIVSYSETEKTTRQPEGWQKDLKSGTGLIVTSDGIILGHQSILLDENAKYKVILSDGNTYEAEFFGKDTYSELAFFKIAAANLPAASFANPEDLKPGEKVIAIGSSPERYNPLFSAGILSGYNPDFNLSGKNVASSEKMSGVFDISLPIDQRYVGGPAIDYSGQVIGIVATLKMENREYYFVVPADKVKSVITKVLAKNLEKSAALGIYFIPLNKTYANIHNLPTEKGAQIFSRSGQPGLAILANSPAANAGLRLNDIIIAVSGEKIDDKKTLPELLYRHQKEEEVELIVLRDTQELTIKVRF